MKTREDIIESLNERNVPFNTQKQMDKIVNALERDSVLSELESNKKLANTISAETWEWLITNHKRLTLTQEIKDYYNKMNTINKEMYQCICTLIEFENPFNKFMVDLCCKQIKGIITHCKKFSHFDYPDQFLVDLCQQYYLKYNPIREVGRPKEQHLIKMIDIETEEVFERFNCRQAVIDTIGIKKARLSKCLTASNNNPNAKSTCTKFKFEDRWYWFVEEN